MSDPITMAMVGAAVGGGGSLLKGKSLGKSLKNAAIGGALGYGGTSLVNGMGVTGLNGAQSTSGLLGAASNTANLAPEVGGSLLPSVSNTGSIIANGGSALDSLNAASLAEGSTGLTNSLIPTMDLANSTGATSLSMLDKLKQYGTIDNLKGAAMVANQFQPQQQPMIQGGGSVKVGQAPTGDIYDELRKVGYTLPKRRETNFSLLG